MSVLFPEGIRTLADLPYTIHEAITIALSYLRWEELEEDEKPKRGIYTDNKRLKEHFDAVKKRREEKWGDDKTKPREIEDPVENLAAQQLKEQFS